MHPVSKFTNTNTHSQRNTEYRVAFVLMLASILFHIGVHFVAYWSWSLENRRGFVRIVLSCLCNMLFLCVISLAALSTPNPSIGMEAGDAGHLMNETEELISFYSTIRLVCLQVSSALIGSLKVIAHRLSLPDLPRDLSHSDCAF